MLANLNLNTNKLTAIPTGLFTIPTLKFLDVSNNLLGLTRDSYLSEAIGQA